jgi:hypothetical protein
LESSWVDEGQGAKDLSEDGAGEVCQVGLVLDHEGSHVDGQVVHIFGVHIATHEVSHALDHKDLVHLLKELLQNLHLALLPKSIDSLDEGEGESHSV